LGRHFYNFLQLGERFAARSEEGVVRFASGMSFRKRRNRSERGRLFLTLQLAVVLPAAALIVFTLWNLHNISRDRAVEAAIQRDFSRVLQITENRLNEKAQRMVQEVREHLPCPSESAPKELEGLLAQHPQFAHAFLYEPHSGLVLRSRPTGVHDVALRREDEEFESNIRHLTEAKGKELAKELRMREEMGARRSEEEKTNGEKEKTAEMQEKESKASFPYFLNFITHHEDQATYSSYSVMTLPQCDSEWTLGGLAFDPEYLQEKFFPKIMDGILHEEQGKTGDAVMMLRWAKAHSPVAASKGWDGGEPEVERKFEEGMSAFPMLVLAIKLRGTTIEALSQKFLDTNFLIIGGISLFLGLGLWQTYRNISRELALARLKSDFGANVSHELRTPLALIRLYAETLEMGRLTSPEKPQQYYRIIREESERLTSLINNILDFSRIEAGRKEYDFRETNLPELVRSTLDSYRYQIERNGFAFQTQIAEDLPPLRVDREAIARSLLNLVNNAVKYSPGEKFLGVKLYRTNQDVKLEVADHGMGIPSSEQEKIFEKFYRVGDPLVHNTKGSGLGLALVRHIVRAHGGEISVDSVPGQGSTFTIALPLAGASTA
jgi:signal transduction histidine kinase